MVESIERLPSLGLRFLVISRDVNLIRQIASYVNVPVRVSNERLASASLIRMRVDDGVQENLETLLAQFTEALSSVLGRIGGRAVTTQIEVAEVRLTLHSNGSMNAGVSLPGELIDMVSTHGLGLNIDAL